MLADPNSCKHKYLVESRAARGSVSIAFNRETDADDSCEFKVGTIGPPRKYCECEDCGKRFPNPRYIRVMELANKIEGAE